MSERTVHYGPIIGPGQGLQCWSCGRKWVLPGINPTKIDWYEGLCGRGDCVRLPGATS
jgi:hypothetical protein